MLEELADGLCIVLNRSDRGSEDLTSSRGNMISIDWVEELMCLDLIGVIRGSEALLWVTIQEQQNYLTSIVWHSVRDFQRALLNVLEQF